MEYSKIYSLEEISKNNGKDTDKVWIVIKDNVYDVTNYLEDHPGGGDLITEWAGKDASKAFSDAGHSNDARNELKKYKIGEVREEDRNKSKKADSKPKKTESTPKVVDAEEKQSNSRGFLSIITCGLCG